MTEINHVHLARLVDVALDELSDYGTMMQKERREALEEAIFAGWAELPARERPRMPHALKAKYREYIKRVSH